MGRLNSVRLSILMAVILLLETATAASNLKWVAAKNGEVPAYPVAGGEDVSGKVLYVARMRLMPGVAPGKMAASSKLASASRGGKEYYKSSYEVLTNPGWRSYLEWKKSSGHTAPADAVIGGYDRGRPLYVARVLYADGHMIPGKAAYFYGKAYIPYGGKEYEAKQWYVLVEHPRSGRKRGLASRFEYPDLPGVKPMKRAPTRSMRRLSHRG